MLHVIFGLLGCLLNGSGLTLICVTIVWLQLTDEIEH